MKDLKESYLKYKYIIWPLVSGLSFLIILFLVILPQFFSFIKINKQIDDLKERSSSLEAKAATLETLNESELQDNLKVVFTILPRNQDVPQSFSTLQQIIDKSGLGLKSTTFSSGGGQTSNSFKLNVSVVGQITAIRDFLIKLQNSPQIFRMESISVSFTRNNSLVEATIPITVFYENIPATIKTQQESLAQLSEDEKSLLAQLKLLAQNISSQETNFSSVSFGKADPFE